MNLILEVTGEKQKDKAAKVATARTLWVPAVNNHGGFGRWAFLEIADPGTRRTLIRGRAAADAVEVETTESQHMAEKNSTNGPNPVDSIRHKDKRANIPTEELRDFVADDEDDPQDHALSARPVPRPATGLEGQGRAGRQDLAVPVVPIYIQEKIHPQAIIEDLRRSRAQAGRAASAEQLTSSPISTASRDFEQKVEFYQHEQNWANRMILGDSLLVMTSLAEKEGLKGKVQTIYIDPPYGIKFGSNWQVSTRKRDVKDGKAEDATRQPEQITRLPRHLEARHPLLPGLPARPPGRGARTAHRERAASSCRSAMRMCTWCGA